jgi:hypothetical protein
MKLLEVGIKDKSTPYRDILRSLGLGTPAAIEHLFRTVQDNLRKAETEPFEVEAMYEGEAPADELPLGVLILGDKQCAAFDVGYNVLLALREDNLTVVYNVRGLFLDLVDEMRMRFALATAPTGTTTFRKAQAGCISALASLLGLGYSVAAGPVWEDEVTVRVSNRLGTTVVVGVQPLSGMLQTMLHGNRENVTNPEHVFGVIAAMATSHNTEKVLA